MEGWSGGHGGPGLGPRTDTVWILWLRDPTQTAKTNNNSGRQRRKFLPGWTARGEGRLAGTPRRRLGQSARGRRRFQGAPRRPFPPPPRTPPSRALRSGAGIAETFPCTRPGNTAGAAAQAHTPSAPRTPPGAHHPGRLSERSTARVTCTGRWGRSLPVNPCLWVGSCISLFSILKHVSRGKKREREESEKVHPGLCKPGKAGP